MRQYSWTIRDQMDDQQLGENLEKNTADGMTITVQKRWTRDDESEWPEAAQWIKEQFERLRVILSGVASEREQTGAIASDHRERRAASSNTALSAPQTSDPVWE